MKRMYKSVLVVLILTLLIATTASAMPSSARSWETVVSQDLLDRMEGATEEERIPVGIWITETDIEAVEKEALAKTGLNKAKIRELDQAGVNLPFAEVEAYITAERSIYADRQEKISARFVDRISALLSKETPMEERNLYNKFTGDSSHASLSPSVGGYVNLDLEILDPNGNVVGQSNVTYGNVEIVQFNPTVSGTYTARVKLKTVPAQKAYFSVAWW